MAFFLLLILALAMMVVSYLIQPKQKASASEITDMDNPTADAGKPIPVLFGTKTIKGLNVIWYGEKTYSKQKVKA